MDFEVVRNVIAETLGCDLEDVKLEASLANAEAADRFQFLRMGYFCADKDSQPGKLIFNRAVSLKDGFKPGK